MRVFWYIADIFFENAVETKEKTISGETGSIADKERFLRPRGAAFSEQLCLQERASRFSAGDLRRAYGFLGLLTSLQRKI